MLLVNPDSRIPELVLLVLLVKKHPEAENGKDRGSSISIGSTVYIVQRKIILDYLSFPLGVYGHIFTATNARSLLDQAPQQG